MFSNLFEHWILWLVLTVLVLVYLAVANERNFADRLNGSIDGKKYWLGFDAVWLNKNFGRVITAVVLIGFLLAVFV